MCCTRTSRRGSAACKGHGYELIARLQQRVDSTICLLELVNELVAVQVRITADIIGCILADDFFLRLEKSVLIAHARYVGEEAARFMKENNLCLEEFVELAKAQQEQEALKEAEME